MIYTTEQIRERVIPIAKKYQIPAVYLFGSYARGTATEESDLDFLIEPPGVQVHCLKRLGIYNDFDDAFEKSVDLVELESFQQKEWMPSEIHFRENVLRERKMIYALS